MALITSHTIVHAEETAHAIIELRLTSYQELESTMQLLSHELQLQQLNCSQPQCVMLQIALTVCKVYTESDAASHILQLALGASILRIVYYYSYYTILYYILS